MAAKIVTRIVVGEARTPIGLCGQGWAESNEQIRREITQSDARYYAQNGGVEGPRRITLCPSGADHAGSTGLCVESRADLTEQLDDLPECYHETAESEQDGTVRLYPTHYPLMSRRRLTDQPPDYGVHDRHETQ